MVLLGTQAKLSTTLQSYAGFPLGAAKIKQMALGDFDRAFGIGHANSNGDAILAANQWKALHYVNF